MAMNIPYSVNGLINGFGGFHIGQQQTQIDYSRFYQSPTGSWQQLPTVSMFAPNQVVSPFDGPMFTSSPMKQRPITKNLNYPYAGDFSSIVPNESTVYAPQSTVIRPIPQRIIPEQCYQQSAQYPVGNWGTPPSTNQTGAKDFEVGVWNEPQRQMNYTVPEQTFEIGYWNFPPPTVPIQNVVHKRSPYGEFKPLCPFCRRNGEPKSFYETHEIRDSDTGIVTCPILRSLVCGRCGATGDEGHTIKYCPMIRSGKNGKKPPSPTMDQFLPNMEEKKK